MTLPLNLPLVRRARQEAKEAGLAGPDPVSRLLGTLLSICEALSALLTTLTIRRPMGMRLTAMMAGAVFLTAVASGFLGYRFGRADVLAECGRRAFVTTAGVACVLWPASTSPK